MSELEKVWRQSLDQQLGRGGSIPRELCENHYRAGRMRQQESAQHVGVQVNKPTSQEDNDIATPGL